MRPLGNEEFVGIIEKLSALTKTTLVWTADSETEFTASSGRYTYRIESRDDDGGHPFDFTIHTRDDGAVVAEVSTFDEEASAVLVDRMDRLYELARRDALGIAELASEINEDLDKLRPEYGPDEAPF